MMNVEATERYCLLNRKTSLAPQQDIRGVRGWLVKCLFASEQGHLGMQHNILLSSLWEIVFHNREREEESLFVLVQRR